MSAWWGVVWLIVLLAANAFFVGAEFAVLAARRAQVEPLARSGNAAAKISLWAMEHATLMLACSQLGITVCSLLILNLSEPAIHHVIEGPLSALGPIPEREHAMKFYTYLIDRGAPVRLPQIAAPAVDFEPPKSSVLYVCALRGS